MDSNLLKEAIADAKAVRQTALANAKVALEEAFSEKYHAMFAEKLAEDAAMDETKPAEEEGMKSAEETVSNEEIDELIKELENETKPEGEAPPEGDAGAAVPPEGDAAAGAPAPAAMPPIGGAAPMPPMGGAGAAPAVCPPGTIPCPGAPGGQPIPQGPAPGGEMGAPAVPPVGGEAMPPAPMGGEAPPAPPIGGEETPTPPSDVPPTGQEEDEELDLNELLESLKEEIEQEECKEEEEEGKKLNEATKLASSGIGGSKAGGSDNKKPSAASSSSSKIESAGNDDEGMPSLDQPKTTAKEPTTAARPNKGPHATKENLSTPSMGAGNGSGGQSETGQPKLDQPKTTAKEPTQASRPNQGAHATKTNLSTPGGMLEENTALKKQLNEAEEVIRYVKGQLNEVNLLNAKLLYTNKLFKEYNMNNEHKMRIVEMFDLAKTVREVKLTYANIAESLNFGGSDIRKKAASAPSNVQSITEGLASKPVGSTKPPTKQIITEASNMAARFQKLAGIKKPSK
jgi:hypothetical protein